MMHTSIKAHQAVTRELFQAADPASARAVQDMVRHHVIIKKTIDTDTIGFVAGADAAYSQNQVCAALVVMTFPELGVVEIRCNLAKISFPYIPGLFSFREGLPLVEAFTRLTRIPDLIVLNGHGDAHPRNAGIASHVGVVLDMPSVGVAQRLLNGAAAVPGISRGSTSRVCAGREVIGMAVRTKERSKPVYVSAGHKVDLAQAVDLVLRMTAAHRFPEPLRYADVMSRKCLKEAEENRPVNS